MDDARLEEGRELHRAGQLDRALALYDQVLAERPDDADALHLKGVAEYQRGRGEDAERLLRAAIAARPDDASFHANLGNVLSATGRVDDAFAAFGRARELDPTNADIHFNQSNAAIAAGRHAEALDILEQAAAMAPDHARVQANLGNLLRRLDLVDEALTVLSRAVELTPENAEIVHSLGVTLADAGRHDEAAAQFRRALEIDGRLVVAAVQLFKSTSQLCAWDGRDRLVEGMCRIARENRPEMGQLSPLISLYLPLSQHEQARIAMAKSAQLRGKTGAARGGLGLGAGAVATPERLRIGYLSPDFRDHAVAHLTRRLFALHDRARVEVFAYSIGIDDGSRYRAEFERSADRFVDLYAAAHAEAAHRISDDGVHILVDLAGHTLGGRPEILALRPAPLQIGWLGFAGSMGGLNDYLIADPIVVPAGADEAYAEAIVRLPDTAMIVDDAAFEEAAVPERAACGLPEGGVAAGRPVLCAFNAAMKIEPQIFAVWLRILERVPGAVLWLRGRADALADNLRGQAAAVGIDPARLVFAPGVADKAAHLARHRCADLFLDTMVYGGHTTLADALVAGLPAVTCAGATFQSRVGASLCVAARMADMVTSDLVGYENLAVALASNPATLGDASERLAHALGDGDARAPLFDTAARVRQLERAYATIWARHTGGEAPDNINVSSEEETARF